jgi:hypothetical protein
LHLKLQIMYLLLQLLYLQIGLWRLCRRWCRLIQAGILPGWVFASHSRHWV